MKAKIQHFDSWILLSRLYCFISKILLKEFVELSKILLQTFFHMSLVYKHYLSKSIIKHTVFSFKFKGWKHCWNRQMADVATVSALWKNVFTKLTGKHLCGVSFWIKLQILGLRNIVNNNKGKWIYQSLL